MSTDDETEQKHCPSAARKDQSIDRPKVKSTDNEIRSLEHGIRQNAIRNSNNIVDLISLITSTSTSSSNSKMSTKAIHSCRRSLNMLHSNASSKNFRSWLSERTNDYTNVLIQLLGSSDISQNTHDAIVASAALSPHPVFLFILRSLLDHNLCPQAIDLIHAAVAKFSDLSYFAFVAIHDDNDNNELTTTCLNLLYAASEAPPFKDTCLTFAQQQQPQSSVKVTSSSLSTSRTRAWETILQHPNMTLFQRSSLVSRVPTHLLPFMTNPLQLSDFLTASYNASSVFNLEDENIKQQHSNLLPYLSLSLSSLDGLFTLISKHNLDYPQFYHKLYTLLSPLSFSLSHSHPKFFSLLSAFLIRGGRRTFSRSLASAFIKRLVRRSLTVSTASSLFCLRLALELLRTYPSTSFLVHNPPVNFFSDNVKDDEKRCLQGDPFNDNEQDPDKCGADKSSLWELDILKLHLSPAVTRLVTLFAIDMRLKPPPLPGDLNDYSGLNFADLMQSEMKRKAKATHIAYDAPGSASHTSSLDTHLSTSMSWT